MEAFLRFGTPEEIGRSIAVIIFVVGVIASQVFGGYVLAGYKKGAPKAQFIWGGSVRSEDLKPSGQRYLRFMRISKGVAIAGFILWIVLAT